MSNGFEHFKRSEHGRELAKAEPKILREFVEEYASLPTMIKFFGSGWKGNPFTVRNKEYFLKVMPIGGTNETRGKELKPEFNNYNLLSKVSNVLAIHGGRAPKHYFYFKHPSSQKEFLLSEFVKGKDLRDAIKDFTPEEKNKWQDTLNTVFSKLRDEGYHFTDEMSRNILVSQDYLEGNTNGRPDWFIVDPRDLKVGANVSKNDAALAESSFTRLLRLFK